MLLIEMDGLRTRASGFYGEVRTAAYLLKVKQTDLGSKVSQFIDANNSCSA